MPPVSPTTPIILAGVSHKLKPVPINSNPRVTKIVLFENFAGGYLVGESVAMHPPGEACGLHAHRGATERFYVLEGFGEVTVDGQTHAVEPGNLVLVPAGVPHNVAAAPFSSLVILCSLIVAPGHEKDSAPWAQPV